MKNWDKNGKIKAVIIGLCALPNLITPIGAQPQLGLIFSIIPPLLFGSLAIPLIIKSVHGREIAMPTWNDNPLKLKRPLSFFHFGAYFFIAVGMSVLIGAGIKYNIVSRIGLASIAYGLGMLIGIHLTLLWIRMKK